MKAIQARSVGGPEVLELDEIQTPTPGHGEVLIKVAAAGVNRADLQQRQGNYPPPPGASPIIGMEVSGTIADVGPGVAAWQNNEECVALLASGGYAEYVVAPAGQVVHPPEGVDLITAGGLIEVAATVSSNLRLGRLARDDFFLVHGGSGGIGSFAIQYARALGARVIATGGSEAKLDYCRSVGADLAVDYHDDWTGIVRDFTGDHGVDVILDNMGASYLDDHLQLLALEGRLVIIGLQGGAKAQLNIGAMLPKRLTVMATTVRSRPVAEKTDFCRTVENDVWPKISAGQIKPAPQTTFALADAARAHAQLEGGDNLGKILLLP